MYIYIYICVYIKYVYLSITRVTLVSQLLEFSGRLYRGLPPGRPKTDSHLNEASNEYSEEEIKAPSTSGAAICKNMAGQLQKDPSWRRSRVVCCLQIFQPDVV